MDDCEADVDDILVQRSEAYARWRKNAFAEELGNGVHGIVRVLAELRTYGVFLLDVTPTYIAFRI